MLLLPAKVLCARSRDSFVAAGACCTYRFPYKRRLLMRRSTGSNPRPTMLKRKALSTALPERLFRHYGVQLINNTCYCEISRVCCQNEVTTIRTVDVLWKGLWKPSFYAGSRHSLMRTFDVPPQYKLRITSGLVFEVAFGRLYNKQQIVHDASGVKQHHTCAAEVSEVSTWWSVTSAWSMDENFCWRSHTKSFRFLQVANKRRFA